MLIYEIIIFTIALAVLIKASDIFVDAAQRIAEYLKISSYIIGFTLVAIGTSLPELISSLGAAYYHSPDLIIGNIIGSNIANIGLILGISAIVGLIKIEKRVFYKEGLFLLMTSILLFIFSFNKRLDWWEGLIFLFLFIVYSSYITQLNIIQKLYSTLLQMRDFIEIKIFKKKKAEKIKEEIIKEKKPIFAIIKEIFIIILSGAAMIFAVEFLIPAAKNIALSLGISETIVGLSMLALGTSLPELIVAINSIRKGFNELLIGTIIGSNLSNILLIGGLSGLIAPISINTASIFYFIPFMILITMAFLFFIRTKWELKRYQGACLLMLYLSFITFIFLVKF
ncbi:MAG: calcium/sodium antiporter [Nanoarchaeota archaeon]|nr:calcium/sodium antiporter [Nanoarchaeota archaeon]